MRFLGSTMVCNAPSTVTLYVWGVTILSDMPRCLPLQFFVLSLVGLDLEGVCTDHSTPTLRAPQAKWRRKLTFPHPLGIQMVAALEVALPLPALAM